MSMINSVGGYHKCTSVENVQHEYKLYNLISQTFCMLSETYRNDFDNRD